VYIWGVCGDHTYSPEYKKKVILKKPTEMKIKGKVESLKLGEYFSIALNHKGEVYTWGINVEG